MKKVERLVYGLIDPITDELRYIGKSSRGMHRPLEHAKCARRTENPRSHLYRWVKRLQGFGIDPDVLLLEEGHDSEEA